MTESDLIIREIKKSEISLLKKFTYTAIYVPQGAQKPHKSIVELPELKIYYENFGTKADDICLVAETGGKLVGAVWTRIIDDYAHIDENTPSLAIAVEEEYRSKGIGARLLREILRKLNETGFSAVSLSVQKENFAVKLYEKAGFKVVKQNGGELVIVKALQYK